VPTKSGLMLGLGEEMDEVQAVMRDLREHGCDMLTLGQYLQPSLHHLPVKRYVTPEEFDRLAEIGYATSASARWPAAPWCDPRTMRTGRQPAWSQTGDGR
jgi:lipoyl synthase